MKTVLLLSAVGSICVGMVLPASADEPPSPASVPGFVEDDPLAARDRLSARLQKVPTPDASLVEVVADQEGGIWLFGRVPGRTPMMSFCRPTVPVHCTAWVEFGSGPTLPLASPPSAGRGGPPAASKPRLPGSG